MSDWKRVFFFVCWLLLVAALAFSAVQPAYASSIPHYSQSYTKSCIRQVSKSSGYGSVQTNALLKLAYRESRWHNWSHSSGQCHGVFQLSKGMAHGHKWWDPKWNTKRAIKYIKHRYGTPKKALAHSYRYGWY